MKRTYSFVGRAACSFLALGFLIALPTARAQGTAFSYQGRLNDGANPANGSYDLTFSLYDAESAGNQVGSTITNIAVAVSNGLFVVSLDLGAGIFDGSPRWLEIGLSTNEAGAFELLSPRQAITTVPYAIYAGRAGSVAANSVTSDQLLTPLAPADGQVLAYTGGSLSWRDPGAATSLWSLNGSDIYYNDGNVGIGTSSPFAGIKLDVRGPLLISPGGTGGAIQFGSPNGETGMSIVGAAPGSGRADVRFDGSTLKLVAGIVGGPPPSGNGVVIGTNGGVGVGTAAPRSRLHLYDAVNSISHLIQTDGGINAWAKVAFQNQNGQWDIGTSRGYNGDVFYVDRIGTAPLELQLAPNGYLGLGITPFAKLHLYEPVESVTQVIETSGGINAWAQLRFRNGNGEWIMGTSRGYNGDQLYFSHPGAADPAFTIQPNGDAYAARNFSTCTLTIRGGCDLAEPFPMEEGAIDKGSVVVIDDEHPGRLKLSDRPYDTRVAGIVSGANGINPGISLHQEGAMEGGQNVALSGRVYVQADASSGAIRPGDLLTTSPTPGHAMKATDSSRTAGAILGKAMSSLPDGQGMVLVLVTLQ
jgi:hypothetical protein